MSDPRIEAAARALCDREIGPGLWMRIGSDGAANFRAAARAALEAADAAAWQPIESAPKDGRRVLLVVHVGTDPFVLEGYYEADGERGWYQANTHWTDAWDGSVLPTLWCPLPEIPSSSPDTASPTRAAASA